MKKGGAVMKRKIIVCLALILSFITLTFPWFTTEGIDIITGMSLFHNPIAVTCMILALIGTFGEFGDNGEIIGSIGILGLIVMEIYEFLTWHIITITGRFDLSFSIQSCFPQFYIAVLCLIITFIIYRCTYHKDQRFIL